MDLDGDGRKDLISGSWPGELFVFWALPEGGFAAPEMLRDKDGEVINIGGGIEEQPDGQILITGHATVEQTDEGTFVDYHGKRLESTAKRPIAITGTASAVHAVDWDADGDLDLLVGDIYGSVYLLPNEGTAEKHAFARERQLEVAGEPLKIGGDAGPFVADWDGDGDLDLLVGGGDGAVSLFDNVGTRAEPKLAKATKLVADAEFDYRDIPTEPTPGTRTKLCVTDWDSDGKLDLLVGDYALLRPKPKELTAEEQEKQDEARRKLDTLRAEYSQLVPKLFGPNRLDKEEEVEKLREQMTSVREAIIKLQETLPPEYETHGWVWFYRRK